MPDPLPLVERLRRLSTEISARSTPNRQDRERIREAMIEAAAALEALAPKLAAADRLAKAAESSCHGEDCTYTSDAFDSQDFCDECNAADGRPCSCDCGMCDHIRDALIIRPVEALGVAPRLPDGEPRTPAAPPDAWTVALGSVGDVINRLAQSWPLKSGEYRAAVAICKELEAMRAALQGETP